MPLNKQLKLKIHESLAAVLPVSLIVLALCAFVVPVDLSTLCLFLAGAALLILGMGFFTLGADMAMMPIGELVGTHLTRTRKLWLILAGCFLIGVLVTVAEPDLAVLARQTPAVPDRVLILTVAAGVGLFLVLSFLRILLGWSLPVMLIVFYLLVFILTRFVPSAFLAVAFDSGGVTTGPITVPFIMALGLGLTAVRSDKNAEGDSFGLVALCSIGPVLSVLILGMIYRSGDASYTPLSVSAIEDTRALLAAFGTAVPEYAKEVALALGPILAFFLVFQVLFFRLRRRALAKILVGILYTFLGLTLFLTGVNVGFMPAGHFLGAQIAKLPYHWVLIPIGMVVGYFIVAAEPAVHVLNQQVEDLTGGAVSQKAMGLALSLGMAAALGLAMVRVLTGISILWFLVPGYVLALSLSFQVPKVFTAIAFDSGGVASGPMTATFLLPFAMGACEALGGNVLTDAFGIVAMVAMTPLVAIQVLGLVYQKKSALEAERALLTAVEADEIIIYDDADQETVRLEDA